MLVIYILLFIILALLLWIIFVPVYLRVDTVTGLYKMSQAGTVSMSLHPGESIWWRVRVFGFQVPVKVGRQQEKRKSVKAPAKQKSRFKRSAAAWRYMLRGVFGSITLQRLECSVDLDNVVLSAQLVPALMLVNHGPVNITTNFNGRYYLHLKLKARLNKLIWTFIRFLTKK